MFDRAICHAAELLTAQPFVSIDALAALSTLLDLTLKNCTPSAAPFSGASRGSHEQNRGATHVKPDGNAKGADTDTIIPRSQQQMDLFGSGPSNSALRAPAWSELPGEARAALTILMTQLILGHVAATALPRAKEVGHDL